MSEESPCYSCLNSNTKSCRNCMNEDQHIGTADSNYHLINNYELDTHGDDYFESVENADNFNGQFL